MFKAADAVSRPGVEETRLRILAAARELYARKGSRGTTTREVAELADVNEATLFRHFGTKGQLLAAMLDYYTESSQISQLLEKVRTLPFDEQFHLLGWEAVEAVKRKQDLIKVGIAEELYNPEGSVCAWRGPEEARRALVGFMREKDASSCRCSSRMSWHARSGASAARFRKPRPWTLWSTSF